MSERSRKLGYRLQALGLLPQLLHSFAVGDIAHDRRDRRWALLSVEDGRRDTDGNGPAAAPDFDLREITRGGTVQATAPFLAVTFVENHDTARSDPLVRDKMLAYAYVLTHEGYPCVFWQDYYNFELARSGSRSGVEALVGAHEKHARGQTDVLHVDPSLYIMQRRGVDGNGGLVFVLNSRRDGNWRGETVQTGFPSARFEPVAFHGEGDPGVPEVETTDAQGRGDFWAAPRGYTVYAPVA